MGRKGWKTMGWQGLTMQVPPACGTSSRMAATPKRAACGWTTASFKRHGVLGVDIRWIPVKGKVTDADLEKRLAQYLASIEKSAKRQKFAATSQVKDVRDERRPERNGVRAFTWKADRKAVGRILVLFGMSARRHRPGRRRTARRLQRSGRRCPANAGMPCVRRRLAHLVAVRLAHAGSERLCLERPSRS